MSERKTLISIISPVYGAPRLIRDLVSEIEKSVRKITNEYEIILVEDHSPDDSAMIIRELCKENPKVKGVILSRNFGQQYALNAGLDLASGEWVVTLDCDLQNPPSEIPNLYMKAKEGYDIVYASRQERKDNIISRYGSYIFNKVLSFLTDTSQDNTIAEFVIYNRRVVDAMKQMGDYVRYYPLMSQWVGYNFTKIKVLQDERNDGIKSSYSFAKRLKLAISTAISFSTKPLKLIVVLGMAMVSFAIILAIVMALQYIFAGIDVSGWLTLFVSLWFIAGIMIMIIGIIAIYLSQVYEEVKRRPSYIVAEKLNF